MRTAFMAMFVLGMLRGPDWIAYLFGLLALALSAFEDINEWKKRGIDEGNT